VQRRGWVVGVLKAGHESQVLLELGNESGSNGREVECGGYLSGGGAAVALDMNLSEGSSSVL